MTWRITITVTDAKLTSTLNALGKSGLRLEVERVGGPDGSLPVSALGDSPIVSLGAKEPALGTNAARLVALLEKLEGEHGAHRVTRAMMNDAMKKAKFTESQLSTAITNAVASKYLVLT